MALLHSLRRWRASLGRVTVGLFAVSWLGLAVQPCMAGTGPMDAHAGMHAHHAGDAPAEPVTHDCPHCPPSPSGHHDCASGTALECDAVGVPALPAKDTQPAQPADIGLGPLLTTYWADLARPPPVVATFSPVDSPHAPRATLQQRYCSYLK